MGDFARDLARDQLRTALMTGTVAGLLPIPGSATLALTALEAVFVSKTTEFYNDRIDPQGMLEDVKALLPIAGKHFALTALAETVGLVPVLGWVAKPFITRKAMETLGEATIDYFEKRNPDRVY
ncbi:MAG: hypothetical protein H7338_02710 [Candidatus Sericytochromatia bacterium]|nr:hypothetical protein [Candidatus Sericytochromatia bacterium]